LNIFIIISSLPSNDFLKIVSFIKFLSLLLFEIKRFFGEVALKVIRNGCYYGYVTAQNGTVSVQ